MTKTMTLVLLSVALVAQKPEAAESLLQAATKKEVVDGDLAGAIAGYKRALAAAKSNRAVAAKALYQLGECYRKQGDSEARKMFERVVKEYGDQAVAAEARARLAAMGEPPKAAAGIRVEKLFTEEDGWCSSVSADGRWMACAPGYVDNVSVRDLQTGHTRQLTQLKNDKGWLNTFLISPDGKWIAFSFYRFGGKDNELRIVATDGSGTMKTVYKHPEDRWIDVNAWTPDSKEILITVAGPRGGPQQLMMVTPADGQARLLREVAYSLQMRPVGFSPDGKWLAMSVPSGADRIGDVELMSRDGATVVPLLATPADEMFAGWSPDGKWLLVTSDHDGTSSLYKMRVQDGKAASDLQLIRAEVGEMQFRAADSRGALYYRVERTSANVFTIGFDPQDGALRGSEARLSTRMPGRQAFPAWSPDGKKLAWWALPSPPSTGSADNHDSLVMVRTLPDGPETIAAVAGSFRGIPPPSWDAEGKSILLLASGGPKQLSLNRMDPQTAHMESLSDPVLTDIIPGTHHWTSDGRYLLIAESGARRRLVRRDLRTGETKTLLSLADLYLSRQFTFSPTGDRVAFFVNMADKQGERWVSKNKFAMCVLDVASGEVKKAEIQSPSWAIGALAWTPDGRRLVYCSGSGPKSTTLWSIPADLSAAPTQLGPELEGRAGHLAFAPDGKKLAYVRVLRAPAEVWVMDRFLTEGK